MRILPGLLLTMIVAAVARSLHALLPAGAGNVVGEVIFAVLIGLAAGNALRLPASTAPGIRFAFGTVLKTAIVLLGAGLSFVATLAIGLQALALIATLIVVALVTAHLLGRKLGISPKLASLIGVGTAVCGNSAIGATAPVIGARDEDVTYAIATNTFFGTVAVFAYPVVGHILGLSDAEFGRWAGTAVNDTSQVVATSFAFSDEAGRLATVVKLTRNALMGGVIVAMGFLHGRRTPRGEGKFLERARQSVPPFVIGFLIMAALNTVGLVDRLSVAIGSDLRSSLQWATHALILLALAGVGLGTKIGEMRRIGTMPLWVGLATALVTSLVSLAWIRVLGAAAG